MIELPVIDDAPVWASRWVANAWTNSYRRRDGAQPLAPRASAHVEYVLAARNVACGCRLAARACTTTCSGLPLVTRYERADHLASLPIR